MVFVIHLKSLLLHPRVTLIDNQTNQARYQKPIGARPLKSGKPKVVRPSPPKVVPSNENNAVLLDIAIKAPEQNAQLLGAKLQAQYTICER